MAYTINGKVYTEHPLMDEMVYNLDIIMKSIEIKNEETALSLETEETIANSDTLITIKDGTASFSTFPFTQEMLIAYGYNAKTAWNYAAERNTIPKNERYKVFKFCCKWYLENYVEKNNYYRALIGLPWIDEYNEEDAYYVYINESYVEDDSLKELIDFSLPLHEYDNYQIAVITSIGALDIVFQEYSGKEYKYLHFLGDNKMDLYKARKAAKWDILYIPSVELMVSDRFKQLYLANRTLYLQRFYDEAYKIGSDYYEEFMIILLLCQTYTDMIADIPEWYVRRDIFDLRSCQYFLESHGISFFKVIPLKYQTKIVKNMNKLIRYKSTNKNIWDIINLFNIDATVYKYYLFKKRIINIKGSYAIGKNPEDEFLLEFVKAPIGTSYDDTIKDNIFREPYDDITYQDKWWDGEDTHDNIKAKHLAKDFTIEGTKYISLENRISLDDYAFQVEYFFGMLLDSTMHTSDITINIPTISDIISFPLSDLFILLYCLTANYDGYNLSIRVPTNMRTKQKAEFQPYEDCNGGYPYINKAEIEIHGGGPWVKQKFRHNIDGGDRPEYTEITQESFYDWLRWKYPYVWVDMSARVFGFNMEADLEWLSEVVSFRHSAFRFAKGYTLEELGVDGFIATDNIDTIEELIKIYKTNTEIHDNLKEKILNAETRDQKVVFQFVFDYLFTRHFDYDRYTLKSTGELADTYDQVLKERNFILYKYFQKLTEEEDLETKQDQIRSAMNDIINTLEYYLNFDCLKFIFSVFSITSFKNVLHYIYLMINFFKSFKVYFLDTFVTFIADNKIENQLGYVDNIGEMKFNYQKKEIQRYRDSIPEIEIGLEKSDRNSIRDTSSRNLDFEKKDSLHLRDTNLIRLCFWKGSHMVYRDAFTDINIKLEKKESVNKQYLEVLDIYPRYEPDPNIDMDLDGGNLKDFPYLFTDDANGGGVSRISHSPYLIFDGGKLGSGRSMFDLDGGRVGEFDDTIQIDGTSPDTELLDSYSIDGGIPSMYEYWVRAMKVRVIDNQVKASIMTGEDELIKDNILRIDEDSLYLNSDDTDNIDFINIDKPIGLHLDTFRTYFNSIPHSAFISPNPDLSNQYIKKVNLEYPNREVIELEISQD